MAVNETIVIDAQVNTSGAEGSVKSLKAQLKDATLELQNIIEKFGETSDEAINAARNVANIKDAIGDANDLVGAFNADEKFAAFSGALNGVAAGFSVAQNALGLFGAESEVVNAGLEKVQGLMDLTESLNSVTASVDAFKNFATTLKEIPILQKAIAVGQRLWNAAMAANPIGAIIVAVTALIAGIAALVSWFKSSSDAAAQQKKQVENSAKAFEEMKKSTEKANSELDRSQKHQLAMAKATGKSAEEIRKLELKLADEKIATAKATAETAKNTLEREKNALAMLKQQDADDEQIKKQEETVNNFKGLYDQSVKNLENAEIEKSETINRQQVERAQAQTDAYKKELSDQESKNDKLRDQQRDADKKSKEDTKKLGEDLIKVQQENELALIKNENAKAEKKLKFDLENSKKEINATTATEESKNNLIAELKKKYDFELAEIKKKAADDELKTQNETFDILNQARWSKMQDQIRVSREMEEDKYQKEIDELINSLNEKEITQEDYDKRREALKIMHEQRIADIDKKVAEERQKKLDEQNKIEKDTFDIITQARLAKIKDAGIVRLEQEAQRYQYEQDALFEALNKKTITEDDFNARREATKTLHELKLTEIEKQNKEERIKIAEAEYQSKLSIYNSMGSALGALSDAIGNNTRMGKAMAVAQVAIDTGVAISGIVRQASKNPTNLTPFQLVADIAIRTAAVIANIKKAKEMLSSAKVGGGDGGGVPSPSAAPIAPQMSSTAMNQAMINQMGNATNRAFVLESDVSGNQERIRRLNRAARIN